MSEAPAMQTESVRANHYPPVFESPAEERRERKRKLTAALRVFGKFGFDEGVAGHFTVRDPELTDHFWVNPFGRSFKQMRVSDLILVNHSGDIVEGQGLLNQAAFAIHSQIHKNLPHVTAAAHTHSLYGKAWASLGRLLDPLTQDSCAFYEDHVLFNDFTGVVLDTSEGERISQALGNKKAAILQNHGVTDRRTNGRRGGLVVHQHGENLSGSAVGGGCWYPEKNQAGNCSAHAAAGRAT